MSREVAVPLAVALRLALARKLGIESRELGWAVSSAAAMICKALALFFTMALRAERAMSPRLANP